MQELIRNVLVDLSKKRSVFHSEDDFKLALATELIRSSPDLEIRLEKPMNIVETFRDYGGGKIDDKPKRIYLDMFLLSSVYGKVGLELKYRTNQQTLTDPVTKEVYVLLDHSANDVGRYKFREDISRLEKLKYSNQIDVGFAIFLTNEMRFWNEGFNSKYMDSEFRLGDGIVLKEAKWNMSSDYLSKHYHQDSSGQYVHNTSKKKNWIYFGEFTKNLELEREYKISWMDFTQVKGSVFKYALIEI